MQHGTEALGNEGGSGLGADLVDAIVEECIGGARRVDRHGARGERSVPGPSPLSQQEASLRRHQVRPVDEGEAFFRFERPGRESGLPERVGRGSTAPVPPNLTLAQQRQRDMGERR